MRDMQLLTCVPERVQFTAWDKEGSQRKRSLLVKNTGNDPFVVRVSNTQTGNFKLVPPADAANDAGPPPHYLLTVPPNSTKKFSVEIVAEAPEGGDTGGGGKPRNLRDEVVVFTGAGMICVPVAATSAACFGAPPSPSSYQPSEDVVQGRSSLFTHAMLEDFTAGPIVSRLPTGLGPTESGRRSQLSSAASSVPAGGGGAPAGAARSLDDLTDGEAERLEAALEQQRSRALAAAISELGVASLPTREEALGETIRGSTLGRSEAGALGGGSSPPPEAMVVAATPTGADVFLIDGCYYNARGEEVTAEGAPLRGGLSTTLPAGSFQEPQPGMKRTLKVDSRGVGNHMPRAAPAQGDGLLPRDTAPAALGGGGGGGDPQARGLGAAMEEQRARALEAAMRELGLKDLPRREDVLGEAPLGALGGTGDLGDLGSSVWGGSTYRTDADDDDDDAYSFGGQLMPPGMAATAPGRGAGGTCTAYAGMKRAGGGGGMLVPPPAAAHSAPKRTQAEMDDAWDALGGI